LTFGANFICIHTGTFEQPWVILSFSAYLQLSMDFEFFRCLPLSPVLDRRAEIVCSFKTFKVHFLSFGVILSNDYVFVSLFWILDGWLYCGGLFEAFYCCRTCRKLSLRSMLACCCCEIFIWKKGKGWGNIIMVIIEPLLFILLTNNLTHLPLMSCSGSMKFLAWQFWVAFIFQDKIKKLDNCINLDSCDCNKIFRQEDISWTGFSCASKQLSIARCPRVRWDRLN